VAAALLAGALAVAPAGASGVRRRAPAPRKVLLDQSGVGSSLTASFAAPRTWDLKWSFDCAGSPDHIFSAQVYLVGAKSQPDVPNYDVPRLAVSGVRGSGVQHYDARAGNSYLWIVSQCNWSVHAVTRPPA
jgi:hypothetical protein